MKEEKNEIIQNCEQRDSSFKTILQKEKYSPLILEFETKENTLIIKITDTDAIGNGLYKCELTKEDLDKKYSSFKMFDDMNKVLEKFKIISTKNYSIKFSENFDTLTFSFNATVFDEEAKFEFILNRIVMNDKEIINQLCEKVKKLNSKIKNNLSNEDNILKKLNSSILEKLDEYNMINDLILEKNKSKKSIWTKIFSTNDDGDTAEAFHSKCDNIENTVILVKTKKYKRFGGYTKKKWNHNNGSYSNDSKAFLFNLNTMDIFDRNENGNEVKGDKDTGPWFGSGPDFQIVNKWYSNNSSHNKKCFSYPQNVNFPLAESNNFLVQELEVYKIEFE
jgi:hypothetical protein